MGEPICFLPRPYAEMIWLGDLVPTRVLCEDAPSPQGYGWRNAEVLLRKSPQSPVPSARRDQRCLGRDDSLECLWMMAFQVLSLRNSIALLFPIAGR